MFKITFSKGFHITFPNGVTLSTQFGWGNYCENRDMSSRETPDPLVSKNAEIAIWNEKEEWITDEILKNGDMVQGYVDIVEWLEIIEKCKNYKGGK
jgi:hypothetical protein